MLRIAIGVALVGVLASSAFAIDPAIKVTVLAQEGQAVAGVGNITFVNNLAVNELAETLVEVDTDNPMTDIDNAILRNSALYLQEGQSLASPTGASIGSFDAVNLNNVGNSGWNFFLDGTSGSSDDSGIYFNTTLLIQESDFVTAAGVSPSTPFLGFFGTDMNDSNDILIRCSIDDPSLGGTSLEQAIIVLDAFSNQTLIAMEETAPPGFPGLIITNIESSPQEFDLDNAGNVLWACDTDAATGTDNMVYLNQTLLAREGDPSPVAGRNWKSLASPECSLNNSGDYAISASIDGDTATDLIITKNTARFRQEGDSLPAFAPFTITSFGTGPILLSDRDAPDQDPDVLWYADWNDTDTDVDTGLFLDEKPLLIEGIDQINGTPIDTIASGQDSRDMSDDGRYIVAEVALNGSLDTALLLDLGPWEGLGSSLAGSTTPKLRGFGQLSANDPVTLRLSRAAPSALANLIVGLTQSNLPFLGGTLVPSPDIIVFNLPTDANGVLEFTASWPAAIPPNVKVYLQYWIADASAPVGFSASNAIVGTSQ